MNALAGLALDVRHACRRLRRSPGFTLIVTATLAIGIGVNAAVFAVANAVFFNGFPLVHEPGRILYLTTTKGAVYYPDFDEWRAQARSFTGMGLTRGVFKTFSSEGRAPETFFTTEVTAKTFQLLGVGPVVGRDFTESDEQPGAEPVVMLRYDFWERHFGKNPAIVGQPVWLNGAPVTVIGVMPQGFSFPEDQQLWTPLVPTPAALKRDGFFARYAFGRLADGASIESARVEMAGIGGRLAGLFPRTNEGLTPVVRGFEETFIGAGATLLYKVVWGAALLVLAIVSCNLTNLFLERALARSRELSVRLALGAGRWQAIRQLLVESLLLSGLGGVLGWWIARIGVRAYMSQIGFGTTRVLDYTIDVQVSTYLIALSVGTGGLVGLAATLRLVRDANSTLDEGGRGMTSGPRRGRAASVLVAAQMALAVMLLAGAGVMIRSVLHVYAANLGITSANVLTMSLYVPPERYLGSDAKIAFYQRLDERLQAVPGVAAVGLGAVAPSERAARSEYELADAATIDRRFRRTVADIVVSPGYFGALGAEIVSGRAFDDLDRLSSLPVVVVNQRFASLHWPRASPLGKRLRLFHEGEPLKWLTVVGVVSNVVQNDSSRQSFEPLVYLPYRQRPQPNMFVFARTRVAPESLSTRFAREVYAIDPSLPVPGLMPLAERFARSYAFERNMTVLVVLFAVIALSLAALGLYATVATAVNARTHEIGVRTAMGAAVRDIQTLVFRIALRPTAIGLGVGLIASLAFNRLLAAQLVRVSPADSFTLVLSSAVLVVAAVMGCLLPARRAASVDPLVALKHE